MSLERSQSCRRRGLARSRLGCCFARLKCRWRRANLRRWLAGMRGYRNNNTRRAAQRRDLLQPERGTDCHRPMAKALQRDQASLIARISTARATDNEPVPDTARSGRANAIVSQPRWYKKSVRLAKFRIRRMAGYGT